MAMKRNCASAAGRASAISRSSPARGAVKRDDDLHRSDAQRQHQGEMPDLVDHGVRPRAVCIARLSQMRSPAPNPGE